MSKPKASEGPKAQPERAGGVQVVPREYAGKWVAWSSDGRRIVAVGESFDDCERAAVPGDSRRIKSRSTGPRSGVNASPGRACEVR